MFPPFGEDARWSEHEKSLVVSARQVEEYIPSTTFDGQKQGMLFKLGEPGMGYYRDTGIGGQRTPKRS